MLERKWLGDKTKGGFYKKAKSGDGKEDQRLALDWKTLEYHPRQKPKFAALEMAKNIEETAPRLRMLLGLDGGAPQKPDKASNIFVDRPLRSLDLFRKSHPGNFRFHRRNRSRHAHGLCLGAWPV